MAASAAKKKIRKTGKVEQFKARAFGALSEHAESHDYPKARYHVWRMFVLETQFYMVP